MLMTKEQIVNEAMALAPREREELAEAIWLSAHGVTAEQVESEGASEAARRAREIDRGESVTLEGGEVVAAAREIAHQARRP